MVNPNIKWITILTGHWEVANGAFVKLEPY